jgi:thiol-disulfide isomerase/thioredoxin
MRARGWTLNYLFFELIIDLLSLATATLLFVITVKGQPASQPIIMNVAAPELVGGPWLNTPDSNPIPLDSRRGKVTIVHFWTFGCINCKHNLPSYARWQKQFAEKGIVLIGVHTPETEEEHVTANVIRRVKQLGIEYPVLLDQEGTNWRRWQQRFWPTVYLIDKKGRIRFQWIGELNYGKGDGEATMAEFVEELLKEPI